jgi:hypothetical protein
MSEVKQGFPDDRDRELQLKAERVSQLADDLVEWAGENIPPRAGTEFAITPEEEFALYRMRRLASNLCRSADVPVAAAVYGASQVGKSLFMGRVLEPADELDSPLGQNDQLPPPSYIRELSFQCDINPHCGGQEATALVTRFTTKERFDKEALPEYPVKVRALTRAEWLRVLARGFRSECKQPKDITWGEAQLRVLFDEVSSRHAGEAVDREWRIDLLDAYAYLRNIDRRQYPETESKFNAFLSQYPLREAGYVEIAGRMLWDSRNFASLTALFNDVCRFLKKITAHGRDGILVHWAAVKFLLDSQRSQIQDSEHSRWKKQIAWTDLKDSFKDGWYVIDYEPGGRGPSEDQAIIQSSMLELILPVVPHRLKADWREVIQRMDLLDLPGMRASGSDSEGGAASIESIPEKMNVVKRGKVFYLIDRYLEERQVQTLLLLVRYGNLEVRQLLKEYVDKWGRARYGDEAWPRKVVASSPAFFIGLTGIDAEFKDLAPNRYLYDNRLNQLVNETLYEVMTDFGGPSQPFTNIFPIRYAGTWDADERRRQQSGEPQKWQQARDIFVNSPMVQKHVRNAEAKWDVAMQDQDGGLSLICQGFVGCTTSRQKQDALEEQIDQLHEELKNLSESWWCDPDTNNDRQKRKDAAEKVLAWLDDEQRIYDRVYALQTALSFDEGDAMEIAEFADNRGLRARARPEPIEERFPAFLRDKLGTWSRELATQRWHKHTSSFEGGAPWLSSEDFGVFTRFLGEYLATNGVFAELSQKLLGIVTLSIRDAGDRRHAQREYVRVILNDFVLSPGGDDSPLEQVQLQGDYGLMTPFLLRWKQRLGEALASAAGEHIKIPAGNDDLRQILDQY